LVRAINKIIPAPGDPREPAVETENGRGGKILNVKVGGWKPKREFGFV